MLRAAPPRLGSGNRQSKTACCMYCGQPCLDEKDKEEHTHQADLPEIIPGSTQACQVALPGTHSLPGSAPGTTCAWLQLACQNYSAHSLHRGHFFKIRRDSYYILLTGTNTESQTRWGTEDYGPNEGAWKKLKRKTLEMEIICLIKISKKWS